MVAWTDMLWKLFTVGIQEEKTVLFSFSFYLHKNNKHKAKTVLCKHESSIQNASGFLSTRENKKTHHVIGSKKIKTSQFLSQKKKQSDSLFSLASGDHA